MKKILFFTILFGFFINCSTNNCMIHQKTKCTQTDILKIADTAMKRAGYDLTIYSSTITEEDVFFLIKYDFIQDSTIRIGGGGEIKISKETCKIIEKKFYQ